MKGEGVVGTGWTTEGNAGCKVQGRVRERVLETWEYFWPR